MWWHSKSLPKIQSKSKALDRFLSSLRVKWLFSVIYPVTKLIMVKEQFMLRCINLWTFPWGIKASREGRLLYTLFKFGCNLSCGSVTKQMESAAQTPLLQSKVRCCSCFFILNCVLVLYPVHPVFALYAETAKAQNGTLCIGSSFSRLTQNGFIFLTKLSLSQLEIALCMLESSPVKNYKLHPIILILCRFYMWHAWVAIHAALLGNGLE